MDIPILIWLNMVNHWLKPLAFPIDNDSACAKAGSGGISLGSSTTSWRRTRIFFREDVKGRIKQGYSLRLY